MFVFAEESSDGIGRVKIVPDDGSLSRRVGSLDGVHSCTWCSSDGSFFLCCDGVRLIDSVSGSSSDMVGNSNTSCAELLLLGTVHRVRLSTRGDLGPAVLYGEAGVLIGAELACDIES